MRKIHCDIEECKHSEEVPHDGVPDSTPFGWATLSWLRQEKGKPDPSVDAAKDVMKTFAAAGAPGFDKMGPAIDKMGEEPEPVPVLMVAYICPDHVEGLPIVHLARKDPQSRLLY